MGPLKRLKDRFLLNKQFLYKKIVSLAIRIKLSVPRPKCARTIELFLPLLKYGGTKYHFCNFYVKLFVIVISIC